MGEARKHLPVVQTPPLHSYTGGPGRRPERHASVSRYVNLSEEFNDSFSFRILLNRDFMLMEER